MCEKLLFTLFYCSYALVQVLKKKKKKRSKYANLSKGGRERRFKPTLNFT